MKKTYTFIVVLFFMFLFVKSAFAQDELIETDKDKGNNQEIEVRVNGGWIDLTIGSDDLIGGAGTDLIDTYTSDSNATLVDIRRAKKNDLWRIDIRRSDINWHGNLYLYVKRTGSGHGNGNIIGGLSYMEINYIDMELFHGEGLLNNIPLQYQLTGVSLQIPPDTYGTTIIFTITQL
ncbi:hypothetical protein ACFL6H_06700 [Candidatus Latescibacterota bacterium]